MRVLTILELMRLWKIELCDLAAKITNMLPDLPEGTADREVAIRNLQKIRLVLAWYDRASEWRTENPLPARSGGGLFWPTAQKSENRLGSPNGYRSVSVSMAAAITGGQTPLPIILILSRRLPCSNR
jgi:hypothetical protein